MDWRGFLFNNRNLKKLFMVQVKIADNFIAIHI
jgi:hypothetical protein